MKKYNTLIILSLATVFTACGDQKKLEKNVLSIDSSKLKQLYTTNEALNLSLKLANNVELDSVVYYLDDKKIGSVKGNDELKFALENEKFGTYTIKGIAFSGDQAKAVTNPIEVASPITPQLLQFTLVNSYPHDKTAYTQGLEFHNGILYESTGNGEGIGTGKRGVSSVRQVNYKTGEVIKSTNQPAEIFGEGCTILNNKLYQLTYQNNKGFVFNPETLEQEAEFNYFQPMEGWGLANDGTNLYMTDGTQKIYKIDPKTFKKLDYVNVYTNKGPVASVNELEWVNGKIYANFYGSNVIAIIKPETGAVEYVIDFSALLNFVEKHPDLDVFNGVAYNPETKTFFVTGKNWDKMFEVRINN